MIITNSVVNSPRLQDSVRRAPAEENPAAVTANPNTAQEFIPVGTAVNPSAGLSPPSSFANERIDLRVLNAEPVSRPEQRAINAYQSTAQLGVEVSSVLFGVDETA